MVWPTSVLLKYRSPLSEMSGMVRLGVVLVPSISVVDSFRGTTQLWYHGCGSVSLTPPPPPNVVPSTAQELAPGAVRPLRWSPIAVSKA